MKLVGFDLETARIEEGRPDPEHGLGISVACTQTYITGENTRLGGGKFDPCHWMGHKSGAPSERMLVEDVKRLATYLQGVVEAGFTIVSWNGLFDFHVLGVELGDMALAARLCLGHLDLMLAFHAVMGFPLGLKVAAEAVGSHKGTEKVSDGALAPTLWAEGKHEEVMGYVAQDVSATLDVGLYMLERKSLRWRTKGGYISSRAFVLPNHVTGPEQAIVEGVLGWPEPDQSWMTTPLTRAQLAAWLQPYLAGELTTGATT